MFQPKNVISKISLKLRFHSSASEVQLFCTFLYPPNSKLQITNYKLQISNYKLTNDLQNYKLQIPAPLRVSSSNTISDEELVTYNVKELNRVLKSKGDLNIKYA